MPIFISYAHEDKTFVDRFAANLVAHHIHVWVDRWELRAGDSIAGRIKESLTEASALLVVLSKSSVVSEWCKRELCSGLERELADKRTVVVPVLLEDCDIPSALQERLYADFRSNFDDGLRVVIERIASVTSIVRARIEDPEFLTDWAIDWGESESEFAIHLTFAEHSRKYPFTVLSEAFIRANPSLTRRYRELDQLGLGWYGRSVILELVAEAAESADLTLVLEDQMPRKSSIGIRDRNGPYGCELEVTLRWLGEDTGRDLVVHVHERLSQVRDHYRDTCRQLDVDELPKD